MNNQPKSPLANFSILALSAERFDLELYGTLLQKEREEESPSCDQSASSPRVLCPVLTLPTSWGAG